jgi:hypothetical protein
VDHLYIVREDKRDNKTSIEANDSISLFNDICYIYIGDETFTSVGETLAPVSSVQILFMQFFVKIVDNKKIRGM